MPLQILLIWAKGRPSIADVRAVERALADAAAIFDPNKLPINIWGQVNREEEGPLPSAIGYTDAQDYVDSNSVRGRDFARVRDFYLDASHRLKTPVYVLFVVPAGELYDANGFSLLEGYSSVLPVPTGVMGTADGHTYAHEIGHGLSLDHVDETDNVMYPYRVVARTGKLSGNDIGIAQYKQMRAFIQKHPSLVEA